MMFDEMPKFTQETSCASAINPDIWFPEKTRKHNWSRTPSALFAREICKGCTARDECLNYALQFNNLRGIWGGLDEDERALIQRKNNINTRAMSVLIANGVE